jgi:hypothetical protein
VYFIISENAIYTHAKKLRYQKTPLQKTQKPQNLTFYSPDALRSSLIALKKGGFISVITIMINLGRTVRQKTALKKGGFISVITIMINWGRTRPYGMIGGENKNPPYQVQKIQIRYIAVLLIMKYARKVYRNQVSLRNLVSDVPHSW